MKNRFFLWIASALVLFAGCADNELAIEQPSPEQEGCKLVITASIPDESPRTRLSLEKDPTSPNPTSPDIIVKWKAGDRINFFFKQGGTTLVEGSSVLLASQDISGEGKIATFTITVPGGVNVGQLFTLYALHGASVYNVANGKINVNVSSLGFSLLTSLDRVPISGEVEVSPSSPGPITIPFNHLGVLQCLEFKNGSASSLVEFYPTLTKTGGPDWYYMPGNGTVPYYDLISKGVTGITGAPPSIKKDLTVPANSTVQLAQWVMPINNVNTPEIKLNAEVSGGTTYTSDNSKPARGSAMQVGKAYHLYALWNGTKLYFTNNTFAPPPAGNLMHAAGGNDFIGVVYSKGDNNVYYNSTRDGSTWSGETLLGGGQEARIAIDGTHKPHVVFTDKGKIVYRKYSGTEWSAPVNIESNYSGNCSRPDIAVDANGYAHITYTDTKGDLDDHNEIMYAENNTSNGAGFTKIIIFDGYRDISTGKSHYFNKGSRIAVDGAGKYYYIITHSHYSTSPNNNSYSVAIKTSSANGATGTASTDKYNIYDLEFNGSNAIALYTDNNVHRTATIQVSGNTASFINPIGNIAGTLSPHGLSRSGEVAGFSEMSNKLFVRYFSSPGNAQVANYSDITVKSGTQVAAVNKGNTANKVYAVYTDNTDSVIKVKEVASTP
ncbi:MAG: hypothetical protein ACOX19_05475 [Fermentimonas sp.]|jgi:hypothetical protein